jgi:tRNA(Ile)-lysidine synthase
MPVAITEVRVPSNRSTQAAARTARYAALASKARALGLTQIWTAHHADDAVETALLQWTQGSDAGGLSRLAPGATQPPGAPVAGWGDLALKRPLSDLSSEWLREHARRHEVDYVEDPSNASDAYLRNRLRRESAEQLRREAGSVSPLLQTLQNLADDDRALQTQASRLDRRARRPHPSREGLAWQTGPLQEAPKSVVSRLLRRATRNLPGDVRWRAETLDGLCARLNPETLKEQSPVTLTPRGATVHITEDRLSIELERGRGDAARRDRNARPVEVDLSAASKGQVTWFDAVLTWRTVQPDPDQPIPESQDVTWFDRGRLPDRLVLRGPRRGETFRPFGHQGEQDVRDTLRGADIPPEDRWRAPCLCAGAATEAVDEDELLWVCGIRRSDAAAVGPETDLVLEWHIEPRRTE